MPRLQQEPRTPTPAAKTATVGGFYSTPITCSLATLQPNKQVIALKSDIEVCQKLTISRYSRNPLVADSSNPQAVWTRAYSRNLFAPNRPGSKAHCTQALVMQAATMGGSFTPAPYNPRRTQHL